MQSKLSTIKTYIYIYINSYNCTSVWVTNTNIVFLNVTAEDPIPYLTPKVCDADQIIVTVDWHQSIVVLHDRGQISRRGLLMDKGLNQAGLADHPIPHDRAADGQIRYNHGDSGSGPGEWWKLNDYRTAENWEYIDIEYLLVCRLLF